MKPPKHLKTGELCFGLEDDTLTTDGVGSCVVICMWDPIRRVGAMAHLFKEVGDAFEPLCQRSAGACPERAVPYLLTRLMSTGTLSRDVTVRLVGAGNMFTGIAEGSAMDVGQGILRHTLVAIDRAGLTLSSKSVGGLFGRSVQFFVKTGRIQIVLTNGEKAEI